MEGLSGKKSYCILPTSNEIEVVQRRMQIMTASQHGFRIAQEDLLTEDLEILQEQNKVAYRL